MNEFWNDVVTEIEGNEIEKIHIHGIVREIHERDFVHAAVLEVEFWDRQVMDQFVLAGTGHTGKNNDRGNKDNQ